MFIIEIDEVKDHFHRKQDFEEEPANETMDEDT